MVAIVIDLNTGTDFKVCPRLESFSPEVYILFVYAVSKFITFSELVSSSHRNKKNIYSNHSEI